MNIFKNIYICEYVCIYTRMHIQTIHEVFFSQKRVCKSF